MLQASLDCSHVEVMWFVESAIPKNKKEKLYGRRFDYGPLLIAVQKTSAAVRGMRNNKQNDCRNLGVNHSIPYIIPGDLCISTGLPAEMYNQPQVDYVLIAGCDQILKDQGLKLARKKIINYHYSALPAYRGKYVVFWQWYNREPYIGYSFHEVDLGVDTGKVIYQGKVDCERDEPYDTVLRRVIMAGAEHLPDVFQCIAEDRQVLLEGKRLDSLYRASDYLRLKIADKTRRVEELRDIFERTGSFRLANGLVISRILDAGREIKNDYEVDQEGITIPLADGYIKGTVVSSIPFGLFKLLVGKRRLLRGLE